MAVIKGNEKILEAILNNIKTNIEVLDPNTGVNVFWLAAYFGFGECMALLAEARVNIYCTHMGSHYNALHIATERKHTEVVQQLVESGFPLNDFNKFGFTALHIAVAHKDPDSIQICKLLINSDADMNIVNS